MPKPLFGTDGVRGVVGREPMTPDFLARLGFVAGEVLARSPNSRALIAKDTRLSGYMVESALEAGLSAAGMDVLLTGPLPTSAVSYLTLALRLSAGIVISASHNPYQDNGVKFFGADGLKLPDAVEQEISARFYRAKTLAFDGAPGKAKRFDDAAARYIEFCKRAFPATMNLRGLRVVVDCANGAAYDIAPHVFHELGADVVAVGVAPDGVNINVDCGALAPKTAQAARRKSSADIAVLLDGDADRALLIDEKGKLHNGDAVLYLLAKSAVARRIAVGGVVGTALSNLALQQHVLGMGLAFARAQVGDRYVIAEMLARDWRLGGEPSGHIVSREFHDTGDGIITALQVLTEMRRQQKPLSELLRGFDLMPQATRDVRVERGGELLAKPAVSRAIERVRKKLGSETRMVVRPSGTEAVVRVMVEGDKAATIAAAADEIQTILLKSV